MIRVDHINIATENLAETRAFFIDVLGLEEGPRPDFNFPGHWLYGGGRPIVHLQQAKRAVAPSRGSALNHAAFEVADLGPFAAKLDQRGIAYRTYQLPGAPMRQLFFEDPNGVMLELNAPAAASS
jgi:catechol 2,3-dioxygenase-like lactoylglutathione lyase family enzyme